MAIKLDAGNVKPATNFFLVDPDSVVLADADNSRQTKAADIKAMAASLNTEGQLVPVLARRLPDGKIKIVFGYTRTKAMQMHNSAHPDQPLQLKVEVIPDEISDANAYRRSVVENFTRSNPSPMEVAKQQRKLMETFGMEIKDVASLYYGAQRGSDGVERVQALAKLFMLPKPVQAKVDNRELPMQAAIELVGLTEKEQTQILDTAERMASGRIKGESVRKAVKAKKREAGEKIGLGRAEIVDFFVSLTGPAEEKPVKTLAAKLEAYCNGTLSFESAYKAFTSMGGLLEAKQPPKEEPKPEKKAKEKKPKAEKKAKKAKATKPAPEAKPEPVAEPEPEPVEA